MNCKSGQRKMVISSTHNLDGATVQKASPNISSDRELHRRSHVKTGLQPPDFGCAGVEHISAIAGVLLGARR
jgi:hypothetical protein